MKSPARPELDRPPQPDSMLQLTELIINAHHAQPGMVRFADALQTLQREGVHIISGKSFADYVSEEFCLPPILVAALLELNPHDDNCGS